MCVKKFFGGVKGGWCMFQEEKSSPIAVAVVVVAGRALVEHSSSGRHGHRGRH